MHKCINLIRRGCVISPKDLPRRPPSFIVFMCKKSIYMPTTTLESICFLICGVRWNFADNYPDRAASCRNYHKITLHRILDFCVLDNVSIGSKESKVCWAGRVSCHSLTRNLLWFRGQAPEKAGKLNMNKCWLKFSKKTDAFEVCASGYLDQINGVSRLYNDGHLST